MRYISTICVWLCMSQIYFNDNGAKLVTPSTHTAFKCHKDVSHEIEKVVFFKPPRGTKRRRLPRFFLEDSVKESNTSECMCSVDQIHVCNDTYMYSTDGPESEYKS